MKSIYYFTMFMLIYYVFNSCSSNEFRRYFDDKNNKILTTGSVNFTPPVDSLLHIFIKKSKYKECFCEMYIDRRDIDKTQIYLRASLNYPDSCKQGEDLLEYYIKKKIPVLYTKIDNVVFFIFTGMEDLVEYSSLTKNIEMKKNSSTYSEYTWVIKKVGEEYQVYENAHMNPFGKVEFKGVVIYEPTPGSPVAPDMKL